MNSEIPSSIVSLIHYSTLNERGWWEKTVCNLIIGVIAEKGNIPIVREDIISRLKNYNIEIDIARFDRQLRKLTDEKQINIAYDNFYEVAENIYKNFTDSYNEQTTIEKYAKNKFCTLSQTLTPNLDPEEFWSNFNLKLLIPLIKLFCISPSFAAAIASCSKIRFFKPLAITFFL